MRGRISREFLWKNTMKPTRRQKRAKQTGVNSKFSFGSGSGIGELVVVDGNLRGSSSKFPDRKKTFPKKNQRDARSHGVHV